MDWRDIDTNTVEGHEALNQIIAERTGKVIHTAEQCSGMEFDQNRDWLDVWYYDEKGYPCEIPYYSTDLNAAWSLFRHFPEGVEWEMRVVGDNTNEIGLAFKWVYVMQGETRKFIGCEDGTPALALCKAWLAWQDEQAEKATSTA